MTRCRPTSDGGDHHVRVATRERSFVVEGDRGRLQRALSNLLDNAFKYSPRGSEGWSFCRAPSRITNSGR